VDGLRDLVLGPEGVAGSVRGFLFRLLVVSRSTPAGRTSSDASRSRLRFRCVEWAVWAVVFAPGWLFDPCDSGGAEGLGCTSLMGGAEDVVAGARSLRKVGTCRRLVGVVCGVVR
jgi:hypothetical protein